MPALIRVKKDLKRMLRSYLLRRLFVKKMTAFLVALWLFLIYLIVFSM